MRMNKRVVGLARVGSPVTYALALLLFLLPFLSVSCDAPEGYGRTTAGGTTSYTGLDLALGTSPAIDTDHLRPIADQANDDLDMQPLVIVAAVALLAALVTVLIAKRYKLSTILGVLAATALAIGLLLARSSLVDKLGDQSTTIPPGKSASDYVAVEAGFWLVAGLTLLGAGLSAAARPRPRQSEADRQPVIANTG